jgi:hypothetical protein
MTQIVKRAGAHGTRNLKKDETGTWIHVGMGRPFECDQERDNLQSGQQEKPGT